MVRRGLRHISDHHTDLRRLDGQPWLAPRWRRGNDVSGDRAGNSFWHSCNWLRHRRLDDLGRGFSSKRSEPEADKSKEGNVGPNIIVW